MGNIKIIIFGIVTFVVGYSLSEFKSYFLISKHSVSNSNSSISNSQSLAGCVTYKNSLEKQLAQLTNENISLRLLSPDAEQSHEKVAEISKPSSYSAERVISAQSNELENLRNYMINNEREKHAEFLRSINAIPANISQALSDNFKKQDVDTSWAFEKKSVIDGFISKNKTLSSLPNVESECKSKQCKISILSDDPVALNQLSESIIELTTDHQDQFSSYTYAIDDANHSTSVYLDRNSSQKNISALSK